MATPATDLPPWGEAPKTITYADASLREKLAERLVYQAYVTEAEWRAHRFYPGNKVIVKLRDEVIGEGQVILVEAVPMGGLTRHDATVSGYKEIGELIGALRKQIPTAKKWEDTEVYKILYRWL